MSFCEKLSGCGKRGSVRSAHTGSSAADGAYLVEREVVRKHAGEDAAVGPVVLHGRVGCAGDQLPAFVIERLLLLVLGLVVQVPNEVHERGYKRRRRWRQANRLVPRYLKSTLMHAAPLPCMESKYWMRFSVIKMTAMVQCIYRLGPTGALG